MRRGCSFRLLAVLLAMPLLGGCGRAEPPDGPGPAPKKELTILTWNLEWFPGGHPDANQSARAAHMAEVQAVLKRVKPDIFLLQEVRNEKVTRQLCAGVPGLEVDIVSRFPQDNPEWEQQNVAIASNLPQIAAFFEEWKPSRERPPRGFAFAAYEFEECVLLAYSVHLKSNGGDGDGKRGSNIAKREESARQLRAHFKKMRAAFGEQTGKPVAILIGGDWNTSREDGRFKQEQTLRGLMRGMHWAYEGVPEEQRRTLPGSRRHPPATFDHFFTHGLGQPKARVVKVPGAVSDHQPVLMRVRLPSDTSPPPAHTPNGSDTSR